MAGFISFNQKTTPNAIHRSPQKDRLLLGPRHEAVDHVGAGVALALEHLLDAEAVDFHLHVDEEALHAQAAQHADKVPAEVLRERRVHLGVVACARLVLLVALPPRLRAALELSDVAGVAVEALRALQRGFRRGLVRPAAGVARRRRVVLIVEACGGGKIGGLCGFEVRRRRWRCLL